MSAPAPDASVEFIDAVGGFKLSHQGVDPLSQFIGENADQGAGLGYPVVGMHRFLCDPFSRLLKVIDPA